MADGRCDGGDGAGWGVEGGEVVEETGVRRFGEDEARGLGVAGEEARADGAGAAEGAVEPGVFAEEEPATGGAHPLLGGPVAEHAALFA